MRSELNGAVELVAEAIYEADRNNWLSGRSNYSELHEDDKNRLRTMAVAARLAAEDAANGSD